MTAGQVDHGYNVIQAQDDIAATIGALDRAGEAFTQTDVTDAPNSPATGNIQFSASGQQKYISADGNAYNTGRATIAATGGLNLTTSLQTVPGLSAALAVGTWHVHAQLLIHNPGTAGQGVLTYKLSASGGLTASSGRFTVFETNATNGVGCADGTGLGGTLSGTAPGTGGANKLAYIDGIFVVSVAGTVSVQMSQAATAACDILQYPSYLEIFPVS